MILDYLVPLAGFVAPTIVAVATLIGVIHQGRKTRAGQDAGREEQKQTLHVVSAVKEQVTNAHSSNLRDDLDRLIWKVDALSGTMAGVDESQKEMRAVVGRLEGAVTNVRQEMLTDRQRADELSKEVRDLDTSARKTHDVLFERIKSLGGGRRK